MSRRLEDLTPAACAAAKAALADLEAAGVKVYISDTLRTTAEQAALYAQGRESLAIVNAKRKAAGMAPIIQYTGRDGKIHSDNDYTVTNCDGVRTSEGGKGRSPHQLGNALDVVPLVDGSPVWPLPSSPLWRPIASAFKAHGFEWGGDWAEFPDFPHYQLGGA